jgi:integrase
MRAALQVQHHLNGLYQQLLANGRRDGRPMAPKTVRNVHAVLHRALADAVRLGYVPRNVADLAEAPSGTSAERPVWTPEQLRTFLEHVRDDRLFAVWMLFATTGVRRGEVAGLRLTDLDLDAGHLSPRRPRVVVDHQVVVSDPKTASGGRWLALDPATVVALREHVRRREQELEEIGLAWPAPHLVFTWPDGRAIHPARFSDCSPSTPAEPACPRSRRTTSATATRQRPSRPTCPSRVVSARLGHANVAITLDTYSHVIPGMDEDAAGTVAALILGAKQPE